MKMSCCRWPSPVTLVSMVFLFSTLNFQSAETLRLDLIHIHSPQHEEAIGIKPRTQHERIQELLQIDTIRQHRISQIGRVGSIRRRASETKRNASAAELLMYSAADYGVGQYLVELKVGTPPQKMKLLIDTGSDLTWLKCKHRCRRCNNPKLRRTRRRIHRPRPSIFHADFSSSFQAFPCSSPFCTADLGNDFLLLSCDPSSSLCQYEFNYVDGSKTVGILANETVTLGLEDKNEIKLENMVIGCSSSFQGGQSINISDGILGLGYSPHSFAMKATTNLFNYNKFSYCLVDHLSPKNVSSHLTFGNPQKNISTTNNHKMQYTGLAGSDIFYGARIEGISVGGVMLNIPAEVWEFTNDTGTILDSGSTLTYLVEPAYKPVIAAFDQSLAKRHNLKMVPDDYLGFCFDSTGFNDSWVPKLVFHFVDGVRFEPQVENYVIDHLEGVQCLGFKEAKWPGHSTIGNIMQQNHFWEFDITGNRLGFAPSTCT